MNLFSIESDKQDDAVFQGALDAAGRTAEMELFRQLLRKLDLALDQLGHIDYQLANGFTRLSSDLNAYSDDNPEAKVAQLMEPAVRQAMARLVDEIGRAKSLTEEILADEMHIRD